MSRRSKRSDEPRLFDLPLTPPGPNASAEGAADPDRPPADGPPGDSAGTSRKAPRRTAGGPADDSAGTARKRRPRGAGGPAGDLPGARPPAGLDAAPLRGAARPPAKRAPEPLPLFTADPSEASPGADDGPSASARPSGPAGGRPAASAAGASPAASARAPLATARAAPGASPDGARLYGQEAAAPTEPAPASITDRAGAGLLDLAVLLGVAMLLAAGVLALGARPPVDTWPAAVLFFLPFSFLYVVLPLAFWGRTPGMTWAGLVARGPADQPPSFRQATLRWLGALLTLALAGLPLLLTLADGRSLTDRLSGTRTLSNPR